MNLFIYPNITAQRYIIKVKECLKFLKDKGYNCCLSLEDSYKLYGDDSYALKTLKDCDILISLGGDGTFLRAINLAIKENKKICGINCGQLGYLCTYNYDHLEEIDFKDLIIKEYPLLGYINKNNEIEYALNDFVIGKDYFGGTINLKVSINNIEKYKIKADGLIISTAIGSSAYNYSAGGDLLNIDSDNIIITPICPHTKNIKSLIIKHDDEIEVKLLNELYSASIYRDGVLIENIKEAKIKYYLDKKVQVLKKEK